MIVVQGGKKSPCATRTLELWG